MRAARFYGKEDIRIEQTEEPKCGKGLVKIAPAFVGICGTDLHEYLGGPTFCPVKPHPLTKEQIPVTLGHEFSGVVTEIGPDITDLKVGDNVCVQPTICCWTCGPCKADAENACDSGGFVGLSGGGGGLSDFVVVERYKVLSLPANVPLDVGALVEPLAVAYHAVSASPLQKGDKVLVLGGGPIGLAVVQALKAREAGLVITAEVAPARQRFAKQFGSDYVLDPSKEDLVAKSRELCGGVTGPDIVFDCAGVPATIKAACTAIRSRGTVVNVAIWEKEIPFNPNMLVFREGKYLAVLGYQKRDFELVLKQLESGKHLLEMVKGEYEADMPTGALKPAEMITKKIKLEDLVEEGVKTLIHDKENHVKILVDLKA